MAIYTGRLDLADAFAAPLVSDRPDGLWPTVVSTSMGRRLGLVYSSAESLRAAIDERRGIYQSRSPRAVAQRARLRAPPRSCCGSRPIATATPCDSRSASRVEASATTTPGRVGARTGVSARARAASRDGSARAPDRGPTPRASRRTPSFSPQSWSRRPASWPRPGRSEVVWEAADVLYFTAVALAGRAAICSRHGASSTAVR